MKRAFLAVAVCLLGTASYVHADYVKLIVNLAMTNEPQADGQQFLPGGMGGPGGMMGGMGGMMGPGGSMPGQQRPPGMGGPGGMQGQRGMMGGMGGAKGPGGGQRPGMGSPPPGMGDGPGGGMGLGAPGAGGQFPGGGQPGSAFPGILPGGPGGAAGMQGGAGAMGDGPGGMNMPGMMGGFGGEQDVEEPESSPFFVECTIELDSRFNQKEKGWRRGWNLHESLDRSNPLGPKIYRLELKHKYGDTSIYLPSDTKASKGLGSTTILTSKEIQIVHIKYPTVEEQYERERKVLEKETTPQALLQLAEWCLSHGLVDEVPKYMDQLAQKEPKNPSAVAYKKVVADFNRALNKDDGSAAWRERLGDDFKVKQNKHYTLLYDVQADVAADERLSRLENNYKSFYYWFALRGKALPQPERRLLAVLVESQDAFDHQHQDIFDNAPMTLDGFYVPRENIAVFSMRRQDDAYNGLEKIAQPLWQTYDKKRLLAGKWKSGLSARETAQAQTIALLLQAMEDEGERTTIGHEGTRQLIRAIGLVPRNVKLPHWVDFGLASFFETPKGALWSGTGAPSWNYLVRYKSWSSPPKKLEKPEDGLKRTVTDQYFHEAQEAKDDKEREKAEVKAHTMSWALVYYLAREKRDGVLRYLEEIANLPRDLELDDEVLLGCFARAFDLVDVSKVDPMKPSQVDMGKLQQLANQWSRYLGNTNLEVTDVMNKAVLDYKKALVEKKPDQPALQGQGTAPGNNNPPQGGFRGPGAPRRPGGFQGGSPPPGGS